MHMYGSGLTIKGLIAELKKMNPDTRMVLVSSDEEGNTIYKGFYIEQFTDAIVIAGLSGCEFEE